MTIEKKGGALHHFRLLYMLVRGVYSLDLKRYDVHINDEVLDHVCMFSKLVHVPLKC